MKNNRLVKLLKLESDRPLDPFIKFAIAQELTREQKPIEAEKKYRSLAENHPKYTGTYLHWGILLEEIGKEEEAMEIFRRGLEICKEESAQNDYRELKQAIDERS